MKLNKKQNILKNFWFNIIVIPLITFIFTIIDFFSEKFNSADKIIMTYLFIGLISLITQFILYIKKPIKYSSLNYLYIILSLNISLFIGYILETFVIKYEKWYMMWIVEPIIVFIIIFGIKEVLWIIISIFYKKILLKDNLKNKLIEENKDLFKQIKKLENKITFLEEKNKKID